jgi:SAM-dependent methyltransferase
MNDELDQRGNLTRWLHPIRQWNAGLDRRFLSSPSALKVYKGSVKEASKQANRILHLGSGRNRTEVFDKQAYRAKTILSLDPDVLSLRENFSAYRLLALGEGLPVRDCTIDLIVSEYVFEHIKAPTRVIHECARVLKPGGRIIILTPNSASYFGLLSRLTPYRFHVWFLETFLGRPALDTFPTFYRFNTRKQIRRISQGADLKVAYLETFVGPSSYTTPFPLIHFLFLGLHKLLETGLLRRWGPSLVAILEKPALAS